VSQHVRESALRFLGTTWERASAVERRVLEAVAARRRISRSVPRQIDEESTLGERVADAVAAFGGSWTFIAIFSGVVVGWMVVNSIALLVHPFDPYPYILLNLVLSCLAAIQAPVILMSQNRQSAKDRLQAVHDYEVNLKAEIEVMQLHEKLELLRARELAQLLELQERQMDLLAELRAQAGHGGPAAGDG